MGDFNNIIHTAVEEAEMRGHATGLAEGLERGRAEGMEEGLQVGERNKTIAIARNLISSGMSLEDIARMTGLTVDEVRNI